MASRLVQLHIDLLNLLNSIVSIKDSSKKMFKYVNVWDSLIDDEITNPKENGSYAFNMPAAFIEFVPNDCKMLGAGVSSYPETEVNIHIFFMKLNSGKDLDQNVDVFLNRDAVKVAFTGKNITGCSSLMGCGDKLDYKHGNVYKYVVSFVTNFIDTKGSYFDVDSVICARLENPTLTIPEFELFGVNVYYNEVEDKYYINE